MAKKRIERLNSLLKEVISEVIREEVRDPRVGQFVTVLSVDITPDLHNAKVFVSMLGTPEERSQTLLALQSAAGFIAIQASKKVVIRYFPVLSFKLDTSVEQHLRIDSLLGKINEERESRNHATQENDHSS